MTMASVLYFTPSDAITIQATLSITIANWLTINWMMLLHEMKRAQNLATWK